MAFTATPTKMIRSGDSPPFQDREYTRKHTTQKGKQRSKKVECGEKGGDEHRHQAGTGADANDAGVRQRVFQHRLQQHAGHRHNSSAEHGNENAGKSQVKNGGHVFIVGHKESSEQLHRGDLQAAGVDCKEKQPNQQHSRSHKRADDLFSADQDE